MVNHKRSWWMVWLGCALILAASQAAAQEKTLFKLQINLNERASTPEGALQVKSEIASQYGISPKVIEEQQRRTRMGLGEIAIAHALARASGRSFYEIVSMRRRGKGRGWGKIAHDLGLKLGDVVSEVKRVDDRSAQALKARGPKRPKEPAAPKGRGRGRR